MNGFAIVFGKCIWIPPSAKAAFLAVGYFFGLMPPQTTSEDFERAIAAQYLAAGKTAAAAAAEAQWLDHCFNIYEAP